MNIFTDLDDVLRSLDIPLYEKYEIPIPERWNWRHKGKSIFDWMEYDNFNIINHEAPKTKYFDIIVDRLDPLEIWTSQRKTWKKHTKNWVNTNIKKEYTYRILTNPQKEELLYSKPNQFLIEDSPNFKDYSNIILITAPYNEHIDARIRVRTPEDLTTVLDSLS